MFELPICTPKLFHIWQWSITYNTHSQMTAFLFEPWKIRCDCWTCCFSYLSPIPIRDKSGIPFALLLANMCLHGRFIVLANEQTQRFSFSVSYPPPPILPLTVSNSTCTSKILDFISWVFTNENEKGVCISMYWFSILQLGLLTYVFICCNSVL